MDSCLGNISNFNTPVKVLRKVSESPEKLPMKKFRVNFHHYTEVTKKKVMNYSRVQSHSTSRVKIEKDNEQCKKLFDGPEMRSASRELAIQNVMKEENDKEIKLLNSKIKSLIRENSELKAKIEKQTGDNSLKDNGKGFFMEMTFKPTDCLNVKEKIKKRFPREVFQIPKVKKL